MATITKGTYIWNEKPTIANESQTFNFVNVFDNKTYARINVSLTDGSIQYFESNLTTYMVVYYSGVAPSTFTGWYNKTNINARTIEVTSDTSVDDTFYTWFTANTTKQASKVVIEKGTYKWNDNPSGYGEDTSSININFKSNNQDFTSLIFNISKSGSSLQYSNSTNTITIYLYTEMIWLQNAEEYKLITLDTDQEVDATFGEWFNSNVTKQEEPAYTFKHYHRSNALIGSSGVNYVFRPYTIVPLYSIAISVVNCTQDSNNVDRVYENGSVTLKFVASSGFALPDSVSVSNATSSWNKASGELTITQPTSDLSVSVVAVEDAPKIATVTGLGNSDPTTVTFDVPSDFKFTDGEYTDESGNVFVKIPKMYRKVNTITNNQITSFTISNVKVDDNYKIYPVFLAEDGVTELDWVGIGKYMNKSSSKVNSVESGSVTTMTLGNARSKIKSNYSYGKYQLYDWMFHKLWQDLIICKMQTINTNSGSGITTDQLGIYWGNYEQWIDGFGHVDSYVYLCDKPSKYVDSPTGSTDGYFTTNYRIVSSNVSNACISKLGYDEMHPFVTLPVATTSNSSYNTYYCDYYYYNSGNHPFLCYVGNTSEYTGAFYLYGYIFWSNASGVRLCYRPLGN